MAGSLLVDKEVQDCLGYTVPYRLLLGHRVNPDRVDYFPAGLAIADLFGVRHDPAFVVVGPRGNVLWKHVGMITKERLLAALRTALQAERN